MSVRNLTLNALQSNVTPEKVGIRVSQSGRVLELTVLPAFSGWLFYSG